VNIVFINSFSCLLPSVTLIVTCYMFSSLFVPDNLIF
jgi:hypothetical protein